jgi:hypothetical protein
MTTLIDILPLVIGNPLDEYDEDTLFLICGVVGVICFMFFLKLFLLIGGYLSPNNR